MNFLIVVGVIIVVAIGVAVVYDSRARARGRLSRPDENHVAESRSKAELDGFIGGGSVGGV